MAILNATFTLKSLKQTYLHIRRTKAAMVLAVLECLFEINFITCIADSQFLKQSSMFVFMFLFFFIFKACGSSNTLQMYVNEVFNETKEKYVYTNYGRIVRSLHTCKNIHATFIRKIFKIKK